MVVARDNYSPSMVHRACRVSSTKSTRTTVVEHRSVCTLSSRSSELLRDCSVDTFDVQKDDIIILSSDGLWDVIKADALHEIMERNQDNVCLIVLFRLSRMNVSLLF